MELVKVVQRNEEVWIQPAQVSSLRFYSPDQSVLRMANGDILFVSGSVADILAVLKAATPRKNASGDHDFTTSL